MNEPLAFIPRYRVSGSLENRFALDGDMAITPRIQVTRTGARYMITEPSELVRNVGRTPAVTQVDGTVRLDVNDAVSVDVYAKNLFNKTYFNDALSLGFTVLRYYAPPVTYGATLRVRF